MNERNESVKKCLALVGALGAILLLNACSDSTPEADTVYKNGAVYTQDNASPWAQAFAVANGRFERVGSNDAVGELVGPDTLVVDLKGKFVMPGLQDTHMHTAFAAWYGMNFNMNPDQSWDAIEKAIVDYAQANPDKTWIFGGNLPWLTDKVGEFSNVLAHKSVLDNLVSDRPVILYDIGGHAALANSKALALAGIDDSTLNPQGGTIERDDKGDVTGVLRELAVNLVTEVMDVSDQTVYNAGMLKAMSTLLSLGITSMTEVWSDGPAMRGLMSLQEQGDLTMRVTAAIGHPVDFATAKAKKVVTDMINNIDRYQGGRLQTRYVKFVLDGSAGGQTLAMNDPYEGTDFRGDLRNSEEVVMAEVTRLHGLGIGSVIHAVGDRAITIALNAVEQAIETHGDNGVRHSIAHTVFVNPEDMDRFAKLGVNVEFSPYFWWPSEGLEIVRQDIGERTEWGFPVKTIVEQGNHVSAGSDWPVVFDPNPFPAIEALVTREEPGGSETSFGKQYAITLEQALEIFTLGGAYVNYQEDKTGSIESGKLADFIVLDQNLFEVDVRAIHSTQVLQTVIEGDVVYEK